MRWINLSPPIVTAMSEGVGTGNYEERVELFLLTFHYNTWRVISILEFLFLLAFSVS